MIPGGSMLARLGRVLLKKIRTAIRLFREDRRRLWRDLLVRVDRYVIYGADVNEVAPPAPSEGMTFRRLWGGGCFCGCVLDDCWCGGWVEKGAPPLRPGGGLLPGGCGGGGGGFPQQKG